MVGRNDSCPCGSGRKYKKCCLEKNEQRLASLANQDQEIDVFRPGALPLAGGHYIPAVACIRESPDECLFILSRNTRPLAAYDAIAEAELDIDSVPGSSNHEVGPDCLRYLDKIGYRKASGVQYENLEFPNRLTGDDAEDAELCSDCGEVHPVLDVDEEYEDSDDDDLNDEFEEEPEPEIIDALSLFQRIAAIEPSILRSPAATVGITELVLNGFAAQTAVFLVLKVAADESERMRTAGETEPNLFQFEEVLNSISQGETGRISGSDSNAKFRKKSSTE